MKVFRNIFITVLLVLVTAGGSASAGTMDPLLERLDISGFLRMRAWYFGSSIAMPGIFPGGNYEHANYEDIFFRNRIFLKILPNLEIRTVFDISAKFGSGDFALGSGGTNIITRNVYMLFRPVKGAELTLGLMPFSLPGGYILARDATGVKYSHNLFKKQLQLSASFLRAFDDAAAALDGTTDPKYNDDNVWMLTGKVSVIDGLTSDVYYAGEYDKYKVFSDSDSNGDYDTVDEGRNALLHWIGLHNSYTIGDFVFKAAGIFNFGYIRNYSITGGLEPAPTVITSTKTNITAALWALEVEYTLGDLKLSLSHEGATGDAGNSDNKHSFQDIKASHGYSLIAIDNTGGLAVRGSGESPLFGLYAVGLKAQYTLFDSVTMRLGVFDFRVVEKAGSSSLFGNEIDLGAEYRYREVLSFFFTTGVFFPNDGYKELNGISEKGAILEMMLGTKITY